MKTTFGIQNGQEALHAARYWQDGQTRLLVLPDDRAVTVAQASFELFAPFMDCLVFPAWDCLPYDRLSPKADIMGQRLAVLAELREKPSRSRVVLTSAAAFVQRVPTTLGQSLTLKKGSEQRLEKMPEILTALGFSRVLTVREPAEFAIRGDLLDLYPPHLEEPVRVAFFGDQIETMDYFDPLSQIRNNPAPSITLSSAGEVHLDPDSISRFRSGYRELFGAQASEDPVYQLVSEGRHAGGMEHYLPLFHTELKNLSDLCDEIVMGDRVQAAITERLTHIDDMYQARLGFMNGQTDKKNKQGVRSVLIRPLTPASLYLTEEECKKIAEEAMHFTPYRNPSDDADCYVLPDFTLTRQKSVHETVKLAALSIRDIQSRNMKSLFVTASPSGAERMKNLLKEEGFTADNFKDCYSHESIQSLKRNHVGFVHLPLVHGFVDGDHLAVMTESDVFGDKLNQKPQRKRASDTFFREFTSLQPGDLVVHRDHGVGRFDGLEAVKAGGAAHDCLRIVYDGGDRLFVPVESMDVLSRYGEDEGTAQLDKLGSGNWQARKARVRKNILEMADKLLAIAAQRQLREASVYDSTTPAYQEFCARFPYAETDDQIRAIMDVANDFTKGSPMDRLVCGDVGFGKTEVALRAAFIAAQNGDQVALTVPTTLLARQHAENFKKRFAGFGITVAELSRLSSANENNKVKSGLSDGSVQVVIGTHALLAESIKFSKLGLVIVDEEQRFGVKQKERLKDLQKDVHILTLTATPIPRTLQMALTGVRDLSLITTPPVDRLAVRSFVTPFDPVMMREALMREHYRSGQSFIVCPRVSDLEEMEERLRTLVPELSFITAHGQLGAGMLEERMEAFVRGDYDILLATTIIESGLDIPRANTMIIHRADMFGLAQLYQLRGRIGRSKVRGYAYMTYEPDVVLTESAQKRLHVLETLDTLGGGFQLASHDMDIRGAGNLLGDQQSGHIKEVGIELYQQMLEDAVNDARAGAGNLQQATRNEWTPVINLGLPVLIPDDYVPDLSVRIALYRQLADLVQQNDIDTFGENLLDRFGPIPDEVATLLDTIRIKTMCFAAHIDKIDAGPKGILISFKDNKPADPMRVMDVVAKMAPLAKLRPDQKVQLNGAFEGRSTRIQAIKRFCGLLVMAENSGTMVA